MAGDGSRMIDRSNPIPRLFDDFGSESPVVHFGNKIDVMGEVIQDRYDHFIGTGMKTYLTSNLSEEEITDEYGARVSSRLREMCNFITLEGYDRRTRMNDQKFKKLARYRKALTQAPKFPI